MKRLILSIILIFSIFLLSSCTNDQRFHLEKKYYNNGKYIELKSDDFKKLGKSNYILFTYNNYCQFKIPCDEIFKQFIDEYNISIIKMPYAEFKNTSLHKKVLYAPSVIIVKKGKVVSYLDAAKDEDVEKYQSIDKFAEWLEKYIYFEEK